MCSINNRIIAVICRPLYRKRTHLTARLCGQKSRKGVKQMKKTKAFISALLAVAENKTIKWMATWDINPDASGKNKPTELVVFEEKYGGNIEYHQVTWENRYEKLAESISSGEGIDFFWAGDMDAFPKGAVRGMFTSVDDYIDFSKPLWKDVKDMTPPTSTTTASGTGTHSSRCSRASLTWISSTTASTAGGSSSDS